MDGVVNAETRGGNRRVGDRFFARGADGEFVLTLNVQIAPGGVTHKQDGLLLTHTVCGEVIGEEATAATELTCGTCQRVISAFIHDWLSQGAVLSDGHRRWPFYRD
ncbi:hypothetical protein BKG82_27650 [Mycobacteroides chelonae]|uniref:Uncharacterized protein n=1 Tax=Mycobacteroides chelonae TaxID=1774 RepID=A0A1S1LJ19_MYCCH|nr:hypothetical protein BKG82_27650 [Mycobacteroides chelonae]